MPYPLTPNRGARELKPSLFPPEHPRRRPAEGGAVGGLGLTCAMPRRSPVAR